MPHIDHIICPVDLTESSTRALSYAFAWANWYGARVHVVHVAPLTVMSAPLAGVAVTLEQRPVAEIRHDVERYVATVPNPGVGVDIQVFEGDPPSFIRKQAGHYQRAVIVMGSHGRKGFERFVLGSVAERVVDSAVAPTLDRAPARRPDAVGRSGLQAHPLRGRSAAVVARGPAVCAVAGGWRPTPRWRSCT